MESLQPEDVERLRRSVAMLTPGQMALRREDAMQLLAEIETLQQRSRRVAAGLHEAIADLQRRLEQLLGEE